jgi:predicted dehydrogenase
VPDWGRACHPQTMPIAVCLLGCEHPHVSDVLGVIVSEPDVRLAAVWSGDRAAVPGAVSNFLVESPDTAIARADVAVVCAPTADRPQLSVRAARAGRPVLVEIPLAARAAEARAVAREITRSRTPAYAILFLRQVPALGRLRAALRADLLGRVSAVSASYLTSSALSAAPAAWVRDPRRGGSGGMVDLGIHLIDALAALGSRPRLEAVSADRRARGGVDVGGVALGRWTDAPLSLRVSQIVRPAGLEVVVNGSGGSAVLRDGTLELAGDHGAPERWVGAPPDPAEAVRAFLQRLRARRLELNGLQDALAAHEALERATAL